MTKFSVSPVTALGVQTELLMRPFLDPINIYWATPRHFRNIPSRIRLENALIARAGRLQGQQALARAVRALGLSWWKSNVLRKSRRKVISRLRKRVSHMYLAPIDAQDSARMRYLATALARPFVLHLWDSFSGPLLDDHDLVWLVRNADRVLAVSEPLIDDVRSLGVSAETLLFTRPPSQAKAAARPSRATPLRVALLGQIDAYADGVVMLEAACAILSAKGIAVEPVFIGSERSVRQVNERLSRKLVPTGFLSDEDRDAVLASCHLGFLPGPSADPGTDMRSRYSVPSRSMDFFAVGLPAVGAVHPRSATARFYATLGLDDLVVHQDPESLAVSIARLADPASWRHERSRTDAAWEDLQAVSPSTRLHRLMSTLTPEQT